MMQTFAFAAVLACLSFPGLVVSDFNATQIDNATKEMWCNTQVAQCPALCADSGKGTESNLCYPNNLAYECVCDDGLRPNLTEYSETIPYYLCTQEQGECIVGCNSNANCVEECKKSNFCGATHPKKYNRTKTTTSTTITDQVSTVLPTSKPGSDSFAGKPSSDSTMLDVASTYGLGLLAAGVAMGVGFIGL